MRAFVASEGFAGGTDFDVRRYSLEVLSKSGFIASCASSMS